jgi:hypothetical protein
MQSIHSRLLESRFRHPKAILSLARVASWGKQMKKRFTVRVELHSGDEDDYENLHEKMKEGGFKKYLYYSDTEESFALPTAEYRYHSDTESNQQVLNKAYNIANLVKRNPSVISTQGPIARRGLKKI